MTREKMPRTRSKGSSTSKENIPSSKGKYILQRPPFAVAKHLRGVIAATEGAQSASQSKGVTVCSSHYLTAHSSIERESTAPINAPDPKHATQPQHEAFRSAQKSKKRSPSPVFPPMGPEGLNPPTNLSQGRDPGALACNGGQFHGPNTTYPDINELDSYLQAPAVQGAESRTQVEKDNVSKTKSVAHLK